MGMEIDITGLGLDELVQLIGELKLENEHLREQVEHLQSCLDYEKDVNCDLQAELDLERRNRNDFYAD